MSTKLLPHQVFNKFGVCVNPQEILCVVRPKRAMPAAALTLAEYQGKWCYGAEFSTNTQGSSTPCSRLQLYDTKELATRAALDWLIKRITNVDFETPGIKSKVQKAIAELSAQLQEAKPAAPAGKTKPQRTVKQKTAAGDGSEKTDRKEHPYSWLAKRLKSIHPHVEVSNDKPGGVLVFSISPYSMGGSGRVFLENNFLQAVRYARKNQPAKDISANSDTEPQRTAKQKPAALEGKTQPAAKQKKAARSAKNPPVPPSGEFVKVVKFNWLADGDYFLHSPGGPVMQKTEGVKYRNANASHSSYVGTIEAADKLVYAHYTFNAAPAVKAKPTAQPGSAEKPTAPKKTKSAQPQRAALASEGKITYTGGKNHDGTWQRIINQFPPHQSFYELCLGSGAIINRKAPATGANIGVEINSAVLKKFKYAAHVTTVCQDVFTWLEENKEALARPNALVYIDPPYPLEARSQQMRIYYDFEFNTALHQYNYLGSNRIQRQAFKRKVNSLVGKVMKLPELQRNALLSALKEKTA